MRQFATIAANTFFEIVRQPVFLLLMTVAAAFELFLASVSYFGFGDEPKLVKNSVLAVMFLSGLFGAVLSASSSLAREIRTGTALAVLAKPVSRLWFLLAKYCGLAVALTVLTYVNLLAALLASRMAFDAYGQADLPALGTFLGFLALAYGAAGFSNYFLRRPFMADAVFCVVVLATAGFLVIYYFIPPPPYAFDPKPAVDWNLVPVGVLILMALWVVAALALACSTRLEVVPTLVICTGLFLLGLMSDYLFGRAAAGGSAWATVLYTVTPNWQLFWLADVLESDQAVSWGHLWTYVGKALGYVAGYTGAVLALALALFEDRELS